MKYFNSFKVSLLSLIVLVACDPPAEENAGATIAEEKTVSVEVMTVVKQNVSQTTTLTGILQPINTVDLIAEVSGEIEAVNKDLGDRVSTSDIIASIDEIIPLSQYEQAKSQVLSAENNLLIAKSNLESDKLLFESGDISNLAYDNSRLAVKNAEAQHLSALAALSVAKKSYEDTKIKSPFNGLIARKFINPGTMVSPGNPLFRIVDISNLKVEVMVPQEMINRVKTGSNSKVFVSALNNEEFSGLIKRISPLADEGTGGYMVEIIVKNTPALKIKGGMTASIELVLNNMESQLVVPDYTVLSKSGENFIYKIEGDRALMTKLEIGEHFGGSYVVNSGISEGDKIVTVGIKNLGVNTKVNIADTK